MKTTQPLTFNTPTGEFTFPAGTPVVSVDQHDVEKHESSAAECSAIRACLSRFRFGRLVVLGGRVRVVPMGAVE